MPQSALEQSCSARPRQLVATLGLCCWLLQGCAGLPQPDPDLATALPLSTYAGTADFGPRPVLPTPAELHRLNPEQSKDFLDWFHDPARSSVPPYQRLYNYLQRITYNFRYEGHTLSATETLATGSGNCLSLAILTTALAQLAQVEIGYQLLDDDPVFEFNDTLVKKGVHIRTLLYADQSSLENGSSHGVRPGLSVDYFPSGRERLIGNIAASDYLAQFFTNQATEALEQGKLQLAYWHAREALAQVPDQATALNLLAVVNRRAGDATKAEEIYRYAIARADDKLSLLKNYQQLLLASGRRLEAEAIEEQLQTIQDPSPYRWYKLARVAHENADYGSAIRYYTRAVELAPYLHEAHLGLALSYYESGRFTQAKGALEEALQAAQKRSTRTLYEAKLAVLRREL